MHKKLLELSNLNMNKLILLLDTILKENNQENKVKLIKEFQNFVWHNANIENISFSNTIDDLAYDLEFYVEDPQYYGEKKMKKEVETVLKKLIDHSSK